MTVSMSAEEHLAGVCRINGRLTRMTLMEADVLRALLCCSPDEWSGMGQLIELVWPHPDRQADTASDVLRHYVMGLKRRGIMIEARIRKGGYRIPAWARGREPVRLAA